jgi:hypothetical protein
MENKEQNIESKKLIGRVKDRFNELKHKKFDWSSFYHGWLEGRVDLTIQSSQPINGGWVSVEDRLPDIGKYVLVVIDKCNITTWYVGNTEHWINSDYPVTHWMPLPEAPHKP